MMKNNRNLDYCFLRCIFLILLVAGWISGCRNGFVGMPDGLCGNWKSKQHRPDITFDSDSAGTFVIVHHQTTDGRICPVRYSLRLYSRDRGIIQAEGRIFLYYDSLNQTLYLSPGGQYKH